MVRLIYFFVVCCLMCGVLCVVGSGAWCGFSACMGTCLQGVVVFGVGLVLVWV